MDAIALTPAQEFELERMRRVIDATSDVEALRSLSKQLLQAWHSQRAATNWIMRSGRAAAPLDVAAAMPQDFDTPS
jgi:hypothetical protein